MGRIGNMMHHSTHTVPKKNAKRSENLPTENTVREQIKGFQQLFAILIVLFLFVELFTGCKKKPKPVPEDPIVGVSQVLFSKLKEEKLPGSGFGEVPSFRNEITLTLDVNAPNYMTQLNLSIGGAVLWKKTYSGKVSQKSVKATISLKGIPDGVKEIEAKLRNKKGINQVFKQKIRVDRTAPVIEWLSPPRFEILKSEKTIELKIEDPSGVKEVKVFFQSKAIRTFAGSPFSFKISPSLLHYGNNSFIIRAVDKLGNETDEVYTMASDGAKVNEQCQYPQSCQKGLSCIARLAGTMGRCRKVCKYRSDCKAGFRCRNVGGYKACVPLTLHNNFAGAYKKCGFKTRCKPGMLCMVMSDDSQKCIPLCGPGRPKCAKGYKCQKYKNKRLCLRFNQQAPKIVGLGQACNNKRLCAKGLRCLSLTIRPGYFCYKGCKRHNQCPRGQRCQLLRGESSGFCVVQKRRKGRVVGLYQECNRNVGCSRGLQCLALPGARNRCHPLCYNGSCQGGQVCVPMGSSSVCMQKCNPLRSTCSSGLGCGLLRFGSTQYYTCF